MRLFCGMHLPYKIHATLPVSHGGIVICSASMLATSTVLA